MITALSLPFLAKKPIDLPPIVSVELIQITDETNIPFAPKAKKTIEKIKEKEKKLVSEQAPPKKVKKIKPDAVPMPDDKTEEVKKIKDGIKYTVFYHVSGTRCTVVRVPGVARAVLKRRTFYIQYIIHRSIEEPVSASFRVCRGLSRWRFATPSIFRCVIAGSAQLLRPSNSKSGK